MPKEERQEANSCFVKLLHGQSLQGAFLKPDTNEDHPLKGVYSYKEVSTWVQTCHLKSGGQGYCKLEQIENLVIPLGGEQNHWKACIVVIEFQCLMIVEPFNGIVNQQLTYNWIHQYLVDQALSDGSKKLPSEVGGWHWLK